jgi:ABC-type transport system involved in cytochrome c biogenesis permease component
MQQKDVLYGKELRSALEEHAQKRPKRINFRPEMLPYVLVYFLVIAVIIYLGIKFDRKYLVAPGIIAITYVFAKLVVKRLRNE